MASLASISSFVGVRVPSAACPSSRPAESRESLRIEAAHHVNKKATGKHNKMRPKKHNPSDKKRGGTKDYGPLPPAPPIWGFDLSDGSSEASPVAAVAESS